MRLGLFGGTFNPIHIGHLRVAEEVRQAFDLTRIIFVPSYIPPHKDLEDNIEGQDRLHIVSMSIRSNPNFDVSAFEVEKGGNSYSIRTIEHIQQRYKTTPFFIIGQDAFNEIADWFESYRLFDMAHFIVMTRPGAFRPGLEDILGEAASRFYETKEGYINEKGNSIIFTSVTPLDISSSMIRKMCKDGKSIRYLVTDEVEKYITAERMYA